MKITLLLASISVILLTVVPTIVDGQRRFRWGEDTEVQELMNRLGQFPDRIGDWESSGDIDLDSSATNLLQPLASVNRTYINAPRQLKAHVFILLGPTGPTAAHTPDVCFDSREYSIIGERRTVSVDSDRRPDSKCFETRFQSRRADGSLLTSWYAWTVDGTWQATDRPRFSFAGSRYLFKIQIAINYTESQQAELDKVLQTFVADIEKTLQNTVF